jgi:hypothetical protein
MRIHLRDCKTKMYYAGPDRWVSEGSQAFDFRDVEHAAQLSHQHNLAETEVVLSYEDPPCELTLPVTNEMLDVL